MNYVKVESSQIAEVGFGEGHYGPETLGIKFPPNKKQTAAGEPGSEYHYQNITGRMHQALMAAPSIGSYFGQNIKNNPAYPYVKVDAIVVAGVNVGEVVREGTGGPDAPTPGSALALIDTLKPEFVFVSGNMDPILIKIREQALAMVAGLNISTPKMRKAIKDVKNLVVKSRTYIEKMRVGYVSAEKKRLATVDTEARRIREILEGIEEEVARPLAEWEGKEEARVQAHSDALKAVRESRIYGSTETVTDLTIRLAWLAEQKKWDWQEFVAPAELAINEETARVEALIDLADVRDKEQAELAKLRAESAARADADRLAAWAKDAREQAELKAAAALKRAEDETFAITQRLIDEKREAQARETAAAMTAAREKEEAVEAERQMVAALRRKEEEHRAAREADVKHREKINEEVIKGLLEVNNVDQETAVNLVEAISNGLISHVRIEY